MDPHLQRAFITLQRATIRFRMGGLKPCAFVLSLKMIKGTRVGLRSPSTEKEKQQDYSQSNYDGYFSFLAKHYDERSRICWTNFVFDDDFARIIAGRNLMLLVERTFLFILSQINDFNLVTQLHHSVCHSKSCTVRDFPCPEVYHLLPTLE
jgi:hypothetical protein